MGVSILGPANVNLGYISPFERGLGLKSGEIQDLKNEMRNIAIEWIDRLTRLTTGWLVDDEGGPHIATFSIRISFFPGTARTCALFYFYFHFHYYFQTCTCWLAQGFSSGACKDLCAELVFFVRGSKSAATGAVEMYPHGLPFRQRTFG